MGKRKKKNKQKSKDKKPKKSTAIQAEIADPKNLKQGVVSSMTDQTSKSVDSTKPDQQKLGSPKEKSAASKPSATSVKGAQVKVTDQLNSSGEVVAEPKSKFSKYVSFVLLLGVIAILIIIFYQVMSRFIVPLFLSALLVVIFRPLQDWVNEKLGGREQIAALLTTLAILLAVLVPLASLIFLAASEGRDVVRQFNAAKILDDVSHVRTSLGLDMPCAREIRQIETDLTAFNSKVALDQENVEKLGVALFEIEQESVAIAKQQDELMWPVEPAPAQPENSDDEAEESYLPPESATVMQWKSFVGELTKAQKLQEELQDLVLKSKSLGTGDTDEARKEAYAINEQKHLVAHQLQKQLGQTSQDFLNLKYRLLGGRSKALLVETANPTGPELESYTEKAVVYLRDTLFALGGSITSFVGSMLVGRVIMIIGLYFFLLDGPAMLESLKGLSPIDDEHEQELVAEFGRVSRAVVVATLLSALVQGMLAGVGFYFAGLDSIFLLTLLSAVLAMVPFVGAAAVWIPCSLYLYFFDNNLVGAIGLGVYGLTVISMADNVIKPWILHGQSNLHPLLALLSVLGGVAVLGPIGILIGPMIVAFLQTLLKILQRELDSMGNEVDTAVETPEVEPAPG